MFTASLLVVAPLALGALAQNSSSTFSSGASVSANDSVPAATTLNFFLDSKPDQSFVGSIVDANACETTVAVACTGGDYGFGQFSVTCDGRSKAFATFQGSTGFALATMVFIETGGYDAYVTATESCDLEPSSRAVCSVMVSASVEDNGKTRARTTTTYEGAAATEKWFQVPITAGAEKLPAATATCTADGNGAVATGLGELYKVVVVPAAAMLAAGAAL